VALKAQLDETILILQMATNDGGILFGSVTSVHIVEELLTQHGITLSEEMLVLDDGKLKSVGEYTLQVNLEENVAAALQVHIQAE
jgi:ribosomal protein L9